jgi:tRNA 2-selenouridine synthase
MSLRRVSVDEAVSGLDNFDAIIDARSESEFALDHLPGALNWPTLTDAQRHEVGTEYKQVSAFEARKRGAVMAARNIAAHIEREAPGLERTWKPLVYCWRGGQRSGALALVLGQIGFEVTVLEGGYRQFRKHVVDALDALPITLSFKVLCGTTGSGKSRLLAELSRQGAQVLDLEGLARHRGSVLGAMSVVQPSQKSFETQLWGVLRHCKADSPVYVESESRTIGRLRVPELLLERIRSSDCLRLHMPDDARVALLREDYPEHQEDIEGLCARLASLRELRGQTVIERWHGLARARDWDALVSELLALHYDPIYLRSMARNFHRYEHAQPVALADGAPSTVAQAVRDLLARQQG